MTTPQNTDPNSDPESNSDAAAAPKSDKTASLSPGLIFLTEFGPLLAFFLTFKTFGLLVGTSVFMAATLVSMLVHYVKLGHISKKLWILTAIVMTTGSLTLFFNDGVFIKMKTTILTSVFGLILMGGLWFDKIIMKSVMGTAIPNISDQKWRQLTCAMAGLLFAQAAANELIWRTQTTETWLTLKTFVLLPSVFVFTIVIMAVVLRSELTAAASDTETPGKDTADEGRPTPDDSTE